MPADSQFDLGALRGRISKMTDRILMRLHDRAGFPLNRAVYTPGAIRIEGQPDTSLLLFALEGMERYHGSLGRYEYPDQIPLILDPPPAGVAGRIVAGPAAPRALIDVRGQLLPYYIDTVLPMLCSGEDDPSTYGETAYVDADLLELVNERINIGRYVALAKLESEPSLRAIMSDAEALAARLRDSRREDIVLADVEDAARRYGIDAAVARGIFRWIIDRVLQVEVVYLQRLGEA
jgi:chorismate mutase